MVTFIYELSTFINFSLNNKRLADIGNLFSLRNFKKRWSNTWIFQMIWKHIKMEDNLYHKINESPDSPKV